MAALIQHRRGTAAQWAAANPVLNVGEIGYDTTSKVIKIGDGTTAWNALSSYLLADVQNALNAQLASVNSSLSNHTTTIDGKLSLHTSNTNSKITTELATVPSRVTAALAADPTPANAAAAAVNTALDDAGVMRGAEFLPVETLMARSWVDNNDRVALYIDLSGHVGFQSLDSDTVVRLKALLDIDAVPLVDEADYASVWVDEADRIAFFVTPEGHFGFSKIDATTLTHLMDELNLNENVKPSMYAMDIGGVERPIASGPAISMWGDSLTASGGIAGRLATLTGRTVYNMGVGGENTYGIAARMGAFPFMLSPVGGTIPADTTPVDVTFTSSFPGEPIPKPFLQGTGIRNNGDNLFYGTLAGVRGRFYLRVKDPNVAYPSGSANDIYSFVRTTAGTAVAVNKPMPFIPEYGRQRLGDITIFWEGQNGPAEADNTPLFRAQIAYLESPQARYLVASRTGFSNTGWSTEETNLAREFGRRYINIRRYLIDYALQDLGLTPTAQDTTDIANGTIPTQLRTDAVHHTQAAQQAIAEFLVLPRLRELGYV